MRRPDGTTADVQDAAGAALMALRRAASFSRVVALACEASGTAEHAAAIAFVADVMTSDLDAASEQLYAVIGDEHIRRTAQRELARRVA